MAISDDEARRLIETIEHEVRSAALRLEKPGILEILNQWRSDIEAGRQVERKLSVRQSPGLDILGDTPRARGTSSGEFVGKEDYQPIEQLDMLVGALGLAFIAPHMMAKRFLDAITDFSGPSGKGIADPDVRLVGVGDADEEQPDPSATISRDSISQSQEQTSDLAYLLHEISVEAGLSPRKLTSGTEVG